MKSHSIWKFPVFWLVDTVVTWPKMRLWEISGLFETFGSDGSLQDTFDALFETFLIWDFLFEHATHLVFWISQRKDVYFWRLFETFCFLIWKFYCLKFFLIWTFLWKHSTLKWNFLIFYFKLKWNFSYIKWHFCEITNNKH